MNKIMYKTLFTVIAGLTVLATSGQTISLEEAASRAKSFMEYENKHIVSRSSESAVYLPVDISKNLYVFNILTGGYVIVSSENDTESILGYSTTGRIDKESLPDNMKDMLSNYEAYIEYAKNNTRLVSKKSRADASPIIRKAIKPLLTTQWNQGDPYNKYCPEINGKKAWAGCVPTAMAQFMNYYKWPNRGRGNTWFILNDQKYSIDFEKETYNWTNMSMDDIAKLLRDCGYASGANYGLDGTGAGMRHAFNALVYNFYYKGECIHISGSGKEPMVHFDYFYNALSTGNPLLCSVVGLNGNAGHAVVCDGFDGNGFFHINFGWSGGHDGYFRLYDVKNVGYTFGAFDYAIVAEPDYDMGDGMTNNVGIHMPWVVISSDKFGTLHGWNYSDKNAPDDKYDNMVDLPSSGDCSNIEVGIKIVGTKGENAYVSLYKHDEEGEPICGDGFDGYSTRVDYMVQLVSGLGFKEGKYKVYPVYKKQDENVWQDVIVDVQFSPNYVLMIVKGNDIVFTTPEIKDVSISIDENRTIHVSDNATSQKVRIFNAYGLQVYSGYDEEIKLDSPGIYTVKIGWAPAIYKSFVVK